MCPELFYIGPIPVRSWGLMLAIGFLLGIYYVKRVTNRDGKPFEPFLTVAYIMILGGIVGARLAYIALHWSDFSDDLGAMFNPFHSDQFGIAGMNLYGGVLVAIAGSYLYCRFRKLPVLEVFDYFAPALGLGIAVSRIGCFLNGCCFGTPTDMPWGVTFPVGSIPYAVYGTQSIHPAQLYSSLYGLVIFLVLHFMMKRKRFAGQLVAVAFVLEAFFRFVIEYVRYYEDAMWFRIDGIQPTYNQVVSVLLSVTGLIIYLVQVRKRSGT